MYNVQQVHQGQSQLPSWTPAMDPVDRFWHEESSNTGSAHNYAHPVAPTTAPNFTGSVVDDVSNCNWTGSSENARWTPAVMPPYRMWDPVPDAPQDLRSQVLEDLSSVSPTPVDDTEPAQHDVSRSAPGRSEFTSTDDLDSGKHRDASALSRTRSHPNTAKQKQANARESQKRFRMRQKVFLAGQDWHSRLCSFADAVGFFCLHMYSKWHFYTFWFWSITGLLTLLLSGRHGLRQ